MNTNLRPIDELNDFELLDLFEIVCVYSNSNCHEYPSWYENYYGYIQTELKEIIKSRLVRLQSFENETL